MKRQLVPLAEQASLCHFLTTSNDHRFETARRGPGRRRRPASERLSSCDDAVTEVAGEIVEVGDDTIAQRIPPLVRRIAFELFDTDEGQIAHWLDGTRPAVGPAGGSRLSGPR